MSSKAKTSTPTAGTSVSKELRQLREDRRLRTPVIHSLPFPQNPLNLRLISGPPRLDRRPASALNSHSKVVSVSPASDKHRPWVNSPPLGDQIHSAVPRLLGSRRNQVKRQHLDNQRSWARVPPLGKLRSRARVLHLGSLGSLQRSVSRVNRRPSDSLRSPAKRPPLVHSKASRHSDSPVNSARHRHLASRDSRDNNRRRLRRWHSLGSSNRRSGDLRS